MYNSTIKPYKFGTCIECEGQNKKLISKRCFEEPNFCYQNYQKKKYAEKAANKKSIPVSAKSDRHKTIPELLKLATIVFNKFIRDRDTINGTYFKCISCSETYPKSVMQCGHYMPSTYSILRFNELNCNGECENCNIHDQNHLVGYRKNLIDKIGLKNVEFLESHKMGNAYKWDRHSLMDIINKYKK